jgi:hypothetical protein
MDVLAIVAPGIADRAAAKTASDGYSPASERSITPYCPAGFVSPACLTNWSWNFGEPAESNAISSWLGMTLQAPAPKGA